MSRYVAIAVDNKGNKQFEKSYSWGSEAVNALDRFIWTFRGGAEVVIKDAYILDTKENKKIQL